MGKKLGKGGARGEGGVVTAERKSPESGQPASHRKVALRLPSVVDAHAFELGGSAARRPAIAASGNLRSPGKETGAQSVNSDDEQSNESKPWYL
jgi:hypothetical protein